MPFLAGSPIVAVLLVALLVAVSLFAVGRLPSLLPRGGRLERWSIRWVLVLQVLIAVMGALGVVHLVYRGDAVSWRFLTVGVFAAVAWAMRHSLTDIASGLTLRAEGTLGVGEGIGTRDVRGRVLRLGLRSVEIETGDGRLVRMPYSTLSRSSVETTSEEGAVRSMTFSVGLGADDDPVEVIEGMRRRALLSPWSSSQRAPVARLVEDAGTGTRVEMTVFPVDLEQAAKIEAAVREGL